MGLAPSAGPDEVRSTYLRLARSLHPDRFMDASPAERGLAERRMREVTAAWAILGDPTLRQDYDRVRRAERAAASGAGPNSAGPSSARPKPPPTAESDDDQTDEEDLFVRPVHRDFNGNVIDRDPDDVELTAPMAFLLRRGPIIVGVLLALGLFVGTALADRRPDAERIEATTTTVCPAPGGCA